MKLSALVRAATGRRRRPAAVAAAGRALIPGKRIDGLDVVDVGLLVGDLGLDAERAEIVADEQGAIEAVVMI